MKPLVAALVLWPLLAYSQMTTLRQPNKPSLNLRQFLDLTDAQLSAILKNNGEYDTYSFRQQFNFRFVTSQIETETAKTQLDPMVLGTLYADLEDRCRDMRDKATAVQKENISVLSDLQRAKLNVLNEAATLGPTVSQARFANLLQSAGSPPIAFTNSFDGTTIADQTVPGCSVDLNFDFPGYVLPARRIEPIPLSFFLREFIGLTDDQSKAILETNSDYNTLAFHHQLQIQNALIQIAVETSTDQPNPMALGYLYAGIESACRELRDRAATSVQQNLSILTDAQRSKLNVLTEALKLMPTVSGAQSGNLLPSMYSPPLAFNRVFSFWPTSFVFELPPMRGCGINGIVPFPFQNGDFRNSVLLPSPN
jgi:hypothetical protein